MSSEYVRCTRPQIVYGERNLLHSEIDLLNLVKRIKEYQVWRREEFVHKIVLKNKIDEMQDTLKALDKLLPRTKLQVDPEDEHITNLFKKKILTLDEEIEIIRKRLEKIK